MSEPTRALCPTCGATNSPEQATRIVALLNEGEADRRRLDWLETEMDRENDAMSENKLLPHSLFRRNVPVTREAIDEAIAAQPASQKGAA